MVEKQDNFNESLFGNEDDEMGNTIEFDNDVENICVEQTDDTNEDEENCDNDTSSNISYDELVWCFENGINIDEYYEAVLAQEEELKSISVKKTEEKTTEEKKRTSRSFKILHAQHNNNGDVDFSKQDNTLKIDEDFQRKGTTFDGNDFEKKFNDIIIKSKFKNLLDEDMDDVKFSADTFNELFDYAISNLREEYKITHIFVMICEYFNIKYEKMYKNLPFCYKNLIINELRKYSKSKILDSFDSDYNDGSLF